MALSVLHPAPVSTTSRLRTPGQGLTIKEGDPFGTCNSKGPHLLPVTRSTRPCSWSSLMGGMVGAVGGRYAGRLPS